MKYNKKLYTYGILGLLSVIFIWWISSHGTIKIETGEVKKPLTYSIFDENGLLLFSEETSGSVSRVVGRGSYQVLIEGDGSSFTPLKVGGFLKTTLVSSVRTYENKREYVGDGPGFCMHYGVVLYSYDCGYPESLVAHLPATTNTPTTTISRDDQPYLPLKGFIDVKGVTKALLVYAQDEDQSVALYDIDERLGVYGPLELKGLSHEDVDHIKAFKGGFIVYDEVFSNIKYYSSIDSEPESIMIEEPGIEAKNPANISVSGSQVGVLYNDGSGEDDEKVNKKIEGKSSFVIHESSDEYTFNTLYTSGGFCGTTKLCLISGGSLDIYDISSHKPKKLFSINNTYQMLQKKNGFLVFTDKHVFYLRDNLTGYISLNIDTGYCGSEDAPNKYLVCTLDKNGKKSALLVDQSLPDDDSIDKKISSLLDSADVSDVSVYKNFIYVTPELGDMVINPVNGGYRYNPASIKSTSKNISEYITTIGIDKNKYSIINPYNN